MMQLKQTALFTFCVYLSLRITPPPICVTVLLIDDTAEKGTVYFCINLCLRVTPPPTCVTVLLTDDAAAAPPEITARWAEGSNQVAAAAAVSVGMVAVNIMTCRVCVVESGQILIFWSKI